MITRQLLVKIAMLLSCGMAFAANGTAYYNLAEKKTTEGMVPNARTVITLYLHQDKAGCTKGGTYGEGTCLASVKDTPKNLHDILDSYWANREDGTNPDLHFSTNIDLGEMSAKTAAGKCDVNHIALPMPSSSKLYGESKTVSNLCFVSSEPMTSPMGLFESMNSANVSAFNVNNVRMIVNGSNNGADYYPMGAVAGTTNMTTLERIGVSNVDIQGPIAGSMVGLLQTSTIKNVENTTKLSVSNNVAITEGYAGSAFFGPLSKHSAFIGGLVGVVLRSENAGDASFESVIVSATVKDLAQGHNSALGGVAGLYTTIGETITGLNVGSKTVSAPCGVYCTPTISVVEFPVTISGGSAMGGLFGAVVVYRENNSPIPGDFTIKNSSFKGSISNAAASASDDAANVIAVGGLVGYDSLMAGMTVSIEGSTADVNIVDSVQTKGNYYYYAGGIVGYGSEGACLTWATKESDFLAVSNSKSLGSIDLKASGADVEGLHVQSFVGGIVGAACLSQKKNGFNGNTSSMSIAVDMKTSADGLLMTNGVAVYDTLMVGGIAGFVNTGLTSTPLQITKDVFDGTLSVEDSLNTTFVGGIVGGMMQRGSNTQGNGRQIAFTSVKVENEKAISYKMNSVSKPYATEIVDRVGGVCGYCNEFRSMDLVSVMSSIEVSGNFAGDSLFVGGLAGALFTSEQTPSSISRTFVNGDILVPAVAENKRVGYMIGSAMFRTSCVLKSNYHYGENDAVVTKPAGELFKSSDEVSDAWRTNTNVSYTVRNGEDDLETSLFNGTLLAKDMKTDDFLDSLKAPYEKSTNPGWVRLAGKNGDLPYVEGDAAGCAKGSFAVTFVDRNLSIVDTRCVETGKTVALVDTVTLASYDSLHCSGWRVLKGRDTVAFDPATEITAKTTLYAEYSLNKYKVVFKKSAGENGMIVSGPMYLNHGTEVPFPTLTNVNMDSTGHNFVGWNDSTSLKYLNKDLEIIAVYEPKVDYYTYLYADGAFFAADTVVYPNERKEFAGPEMTDPTGMYNYTFKDWISVESDKYVGNVYKAVYDTAKAVYTIVFMDLEGNVYGDTLKLNLGDKIAYPDPKKDGKKFIGWSSKSEVVTKSEEIVAFFVDEVSSSSSVPASSSSSVEPESSSSAVLAVKDVEIVKSGYSAVKVLFGAENLDPESVSEIHVYVRGDNYSKDSIFTYAKVESVKDEWELHPVPTGDYKVEVSVENGSKKVAVVDSLEVAPKYKTLKDSWNMISVAAIKASDRKEVLNSNYVFYWDENSPVGDYWQYRAYRGEDADLSRGYWYGSPNGEPLTFEVDYADTDGKISWTLDSAYSGWNLVANPYGWTVSLKDGKTNDGSEVKFWHWDPVTGYDVVDTIGAFEAVWAHIEKKNSSSIVWEVDAKPYFAPAAEELSAKQKMAVLRKSALRKASSRNWSVLAVLSDENGKRDSWNVIGAGSAAETMSEPPAGMGDRVSLAVLEGKTALAKSVKPIADEYEWTLNVNASSNRDGKIDFEGVEDLNALGLCLFVTVDGVEREVKAGESVKVALTKSSKQVGVRVASAAKAATVASQISGFRAVKVAGDLQMQFETSDDLAGTSAHYALVGVNGKKVAAGSFTAVSGSNTLAISAPKAGVYFMQLKVGSQMNSAKVMVK